MTTRRGTKEANKKETIIWYGKADGWYSASPSAKQKLRRKIRKSGYTGRLKFSIYNGTILIAKSIG